MRCNQLSRLAGAAALALYLTPLPAFADASAPQSVTALPGKPVLMMSAFDLGPLGYQLDEFVVAGKATRYALRRPASEDGKIDVVADGTADYTTRYVVARPSDTAKFNGTVLVEWLNVTAGQDTPADWMVAHREMIRRGYAYVGVSAQQVGVEGGTSVMGMGVPLKKANPARYGGLSHPGDAYAFDIYSQAGKALKAKGASGLLGPLRPARVISIGESQSAMFLSTYVDAVDPVARAYDGFLVHSRFGSGAAMNGVGVRLATTSNSQAMPPQLKFRPDLRVPVLSLVTETDLNGGNITGYAGSRSPDHRTLRVWELAGAAHADAYLFGGAFSDDGKRTAAELAKAFRTAKSAPGATLDKPYNSGQPHHYVLEAAVKALDTWLRSGRPPASTPIIATTASEGKTLFVTDGNGIAKGGVRTPWTDVPTMRLSGVGNSGGFIGTLVGVGDPFDAAKLKALYPGGKADYLVRFTHSLDAAIAKGHVLKEDRQEILDIAAINYQGAN
ncbi:MAG: alpha/beta hydrolase domain-containing protein [Novosphingobium sp.]